MKTWYRVTIDIAYEGEVTDKFGGVVEDEEKKKEIVNRIVALDLDNALRRTASGPVDWTVVSAVDLAAVGADKHVRPR